MKKNVTIAISVLVGLAVLYNVTQFKYKKGDCFMVDAGWVSIPVTIIDTDISIREGKRYLTESIFMGRTFVPVSDFEAVANDENRCPVPTKGEMK